MVLWCFSTLEGPGQNKAALTNPLPTWRRNLRETRKLKRKRIGAPNSGWQAYNVVRRAKRGASYRVKVPL